MPPLTAIRNPPCSGTRYGVVLRRISTVVLKKAPSARSSLPSPLKSGRGTALLHNNHGVRMAVPPPEVFPPLGASHVSPFTVLPVLVSQIEAVSTMFLVVPHVIVAAVAVVVSPVVIVPSVVRVVVAVSPHHNRGDQCGAQQKPTQKNS
jgi:hypothetical protein